MKKLNHNLPCILAPDEAPESCDNCSVFCPFNPDREDSPLRKTAALTRVLVAGMVSAMQEAEARP